MDDVTPADPNERTMLILMHISPLIGFLVPFGNIIAPLVFWLIKKDQSPELDRHGKAVINFQITIMLALVVAFILIFVVIGVFLIPIIGLFSLIMIIMGAIDASNGKLFKYPLSLNLIK
jgi:uncharacterized protein